MPNIVYKIGIVSENPTDSAEFYIKRFSYTNVSSSELLVGSVLLRGLAGPLLHILPAEIAQSELGLHHIALAVENVQSIILNMEKNGGRRAIGSFQKLLDGYKVYRVNLEYGRLKSIFCLINLSINFIIKK